MPDSLTPEVCLDFAKAFGTYLKGGKVIVGTDTRWSSEFIKGIMMQGLFSTGAKVIDLGVVPTPTVGAMVKELKAHGGLVVTASHNPPQWNGLKFIREDGIFLNEKQGQKLLDIYESKNFTMADKGSVKHFSKAMEIHIQRILEVVKYRLIRRKRFKVVYDACNGAGSIITHKLLTKLGCKVIAINADPKKPFPHGAEPTPKNLEELCEVVKRENADLGFAQDPDADRLAIVDNHGVAISEEYTVTLASKHILSKTFGGRKIIVANLSTTRMMDDVARSMGAVLIRTKIGEVHVSEEIKREKAIIGGEGNGGVIYPPIGFMRDSLAGMALILEYMASSKKSISQLVDQIPRYSIYKTKVECKDQEESEDLIEKTIKIFRQDNFDIDLTDGAKIYTQDGTLHVRPSNTEPIIRIISEGKTEESAQKLAEDLKAKLAS